MATRQHEVYVTTKKQITLGKVIRSSLSEVAWKICEFDFSLLSSASQTSQIFVVQRLSLVKHVYHNIYKKTDLKRESNTYLQ
jgi:hypothetical protein